MLSGLLAAYLVLSGPLAARFNLNRFPGPYRVPVRAHQAQDRSTPGRPGPCRSLRIRELVDETNAGSSG
jgi:hypothetical protein